MKVWYTEKGTRLNQEKCVLPVTPVGNLIMLGSSVKFSGTHFYLCKMSLNYIVYKYLF